MISKVWRSDNSLEETIKVVREDIKIWKFKPFEEVIKKEERETLSRLNGILSYEEYSKKED